MMPDLAQALFWTGIGQMCVLIASSLVPLRLDFKNTLLPLPPLIRQLVWVYGGYVVLAIVSLGLITALNADELAAGSRLARSFCFFAAAFWGIRLSLQPVLDARPFLTNGWLTAGYHLLTVLFAGFMTVFLWGACH